jgi:hypothetical protein
MAKGKILLYGALLLLAALLVSAVISAVVAAIAFVWTLIRIAAILLVLGGIGYAGYKIYDFLSGEDTTASESGMFGGRESSVGADTSLGTESESDALREQYLNGEISEQEFERRLERQLDDSEFDDIDRELQRERI